VEPGPDQPTAEQIEAQLGRGHRWLRFPPVLETQFEADGGDQRRRHLFVASLIGIFIYNLLSFNDAQILPDDVALCRGLQIVLTPLLLASAFAMRLPIRPWLRETLIAGAVTLLGWSILATIALSHAPTAVPHSATLLLIPMFAGIAARLRFWHTAAVSLLTLLPFLIFIRGHSAVEDLIVGDNVAMLVAGIAFTLIASYSIEYRDRTAYLLRLLEQHQRYALTEAHEHMRRLSLLDPLTGIANRRQFDFDFEKAWDLAAGSGKPVAVLIFDVDFFKAFNDGYGHLAGDACLQRLAGLVAELAERENGKMARLGGEEFGLLLPERDLQGAVQIGEMVCAAVRDAAIPHRFSPVQPNLTVSVGAASVVPSAAGDRNALLAEADDAMYRAKSLGRNRVETCHGEMIAPLVAAVGYIAV
jgi:diguanylate cyclase (GGDEF)-like protein